MSRQYSIRHVVRQHAEADTRENSEPFQFTPSQACLVWWALHLLLTELGKPLPGNALEERYPDDLRCQADAIEFVTATMSLLLAHAKNHNAEISTC